MKARARVDASVTDEDLLARVAQGEAAALGAMFDRYHRDVYNFLGRMRCPAHELDDLVQGTFLALPDAATRYDGRGSVRAYLLGVAVQVARRERRRIFRRLALWLERVHEVDTPDGERDPEQACVDRESARRLETALAKLPEAQRETFVLVEVEGLKGEEAARILGVPVNTVWTRLHYARAALRDALKPRRAP